ncbi:MAG: hypothetical protein AAGL49_08645, partial [Pseudomonadota bacterium]
MLRIVTIRTKAFASFRHPLSGDLFERLGENRVRVVKSDGREGVFDMEAKQIEGDVQSADLHMCNWVGGKIAPGEEDTPMDYAGESIQAFRAQAAAARREMLRPQWGEEIDRISDADLVDSIYYSLFPNLSPWADFNPIFYRFRPDGDNPEQ